MDNDLLVIRVWDKMSDKTVSHFNIFLNKFCSTSSKWKLLSEVQFEKGTWNWKIWIQWSLQQKKNRRSSNFVQIKLVRRRQIWHFSPHRIWREIRLSQKKTFTKTPENHCKTSWNYHSPPPRVSFYYYETNDSPAGTSTPHPSIRRGGCT